MEIKHFSATVDLKPKPGRVAARICRFGTPDKGLDVVVKGAFSESLQRWRTSNRRIPIYYDHRADDPLMNIGEINPHNCEETDVGLTVSGELYLTEDRAAKVHEQMKRGTLSEWSFGALIEQARPRATGGRDLLRLHLVEVSPTLVGKGDSETLMIAHADAPTSRRLTVDQALAPFAARMTLLRARLACARRTG
jgi:uncharacterized protein